MCSRASVIFKIQSARIALRVEKSLGNCINLLTKISYMNRDILAEFELLIWLNIQEFGPVTTRFTIVI